MKCLILEILEARGTESRLRPLPGNRNMIAWHVVGRYGENPFTMIDQGILQPIRLPPGTYEGVGRSHDGYFIRLGRAVPRFSNIVEVPQKYMEHVEGTPKPAPLLKMFHDGGFFASDDVALRPVYPSTLQYVGMSEWLGKIIDVFDEDKEGR